MDSAIPLPVTEQEINPYCGRPWSWRPGPDDPEWDDPGWKAVRFIETYLKHTKGRWRGVPFVLRPFQLNVILQVFGKVDEEGYRIIRTVYLEYARKAGKSELAAAIALKLLFADNEPSAEIYGAAYDRDQASLVFNVAAEMVRLSPALRKRARIIDSQKRIIVPKTSSFYRAIPADAAGSHGFNASGIIFDEVHTQKNSDLWDVLTTSGGTRAQPLTFAITTAGFDRQSLAYQLHDYGLKVQKGIINDPTWFADIRNTPENVDWRDERYWYYANPGLGTREDIKAGRAFRDIEELRAKAREAMEVPAKQNAFRQFYLNQWVQQSTRAIDMALWDQNAQDDQGNVMSVDESALVGRTCYGGLDLSSVSDLTAWVMVFPRDDDPEELDVLARFWCPEARLHDTQNRYRDQYQAWAKQGYLTATPGDAIDYGFIKAQILEDAKKFRLVDMNVDRLFQGYQLSMELQEEGITVLGMGMGFVSMAGPMKEFMARLLKRKLRHGGNPVMRFCADNLAVKQDAAGNMKPDKASSQGKIDGIVALLMALDRAMRHTQGSKSVYEERGIVVL